MSRTPRRPRLLVAAVSVVLLGVLFATDARAAIDPGRDENLIKHDGRGYNNPHAGFVAPPRGTGPLAPATGSLIGTHSNDKHTGDLTEEDQHILVTEREVGRRLDINNSYYGAFDSIANAYIPGDPRKRGLSKLAFWDIEMGRIPLVGWGCGVSTQINSGSKDAIIRKTAEAMKAFGHEFFMRYCWEMDGNKRTSEVGSPEEFVNSWIRIYNIFKEVGADNVIWVWCGNANSFKHLNTKNAYAWDYYPGDEYVDWISADGYNWAASDRNRELNYEKDRWRSFVEIYDEFMVWARSTGPIPQSMKTELKSMPAEFPRKRQVKPIMIGEYGAIEPVGDMVEFFLGHSPYNTKPQWLRDAHDSVNGSKAGTAGCWWCGIYSDIAAVVYFDIEGINGPWEITSSPESIAAYKEAAQDPWFNQIHSLGWAPAANRPDVPPPGSQPPPQPGGGSQNPPPGGQPPSVNPAAVGSGYWMLGSDSKVYAFGDAKHLGAPALPAGVNAVDLEATPSGAGYWIVDGAGSVYANGDATFLGGIQAGQLAAGESATSLSSTPTGKGYWIFTNKGRAVRFGDATFFGDMSRVPLAGPVLDSIPTPTGQGYYMVGSDGGIFAFGDAKFFGSMGGKKLNAPVQSLVPDSDGVGYWLVASDGGIFAFDAPFKGSMGDKKLSKPVTGMVPFGDGYMMVGEDGGIFNFSSQPFAGSLGANPPSRPIVAVAALDARAQ
ncbi:MAG TPA: glycosyl hydrolase [Acidimicrobiia bacterium]